MAKKRWVQDVKTVSTFPPKDTFTKDAATIARVMASKKVSPRGLGSAIRMIQFFINRSGKELPARRKHELEKAKRKINSRVVLGSEKPRSRLFSVGMNWVQRGEYRTVKEDLDAVARLTRADLIDVLIRYPLTRNRTLAVGPLEKLT